MPIVKMPDGTQVQFPDDMPREEIRGLIQSKFPDDVPAPSGNALDAFRSGAVQGMTFNFADEILAGAMTPIEAGIDAVQGKPFDLGRSYNQALDRNRATDRQMQSGNETAALAGNIVGGVGSGVGLAKGGVTLMNGAKRTIGSMAPRAAAEGGIYGAIAGAGAGDSLEDRGAQAATGAAWGAGLGGVIGGATGAALSRGTSRPARVLARDMAADQIDPAMVPGMLDDLGPDAVLGDLGPNLQKRVAAVANTPGDGQTTVINALSARRAGANSRVRGDVDATIGPATVPSRTLAEVQSNMDALDPAYRAVLRDARAVDTGSLENLSLNLDSMSVNLRGRAQRVAREVRQMLNVTGEDVLDPNPRTLFETRKAIDGMYESATDGNEKFVLEMARQQVDNALADAAPGIKDVDAQFSELARQRDAVARGQQMLDSGRTAPRPSEVADEMTQGANPQGRQIGPSAVPLRLSQGARAEIDRIVGTNTNDVAAMRKLIRGEGSWNRDRLASLFGQDKADRLLRILERENVYAATEGPALGGSRTAPIQRLQKEMDGGGAPSAGAIRSALNFQFGDAGAAILDRLTAGVSQTSRDKTYALVAEALMGRGDPRLLEAIARSKQVGTNPIVRSLIQQSSNVPEAVTAVSGNSPPLRIVVDGANPVSSRQ